MNFQLSWKTLVLATAIIFLPLLTEAKPKEKLTMVQAVEHYLKGKPTPNAVIVVKVMDEENQPVTGATVKLYRRETGESKTLRATDSSGRTENSAQKNDYEVEITKPGYASVKKFIYLDKGLTEQIVLKKLETQDIAEHSDRMPASLDLPEITDIQ